MGHEALRMWVMGAGFLLLYGVVTFMAIEVARQVYRDLRASRAELDGAAKSENRAAVMAAQEPYRAMPRARSSGPRFTIGAMPAPDDYWAIAYDHGGTAAVRDLAFATAFTSGWLTIHEPIQAMLSFHPGRPPPNPIMRDMYDAIANTAGPLAPSGPRVIAFGTAIVAAAAAASDHESGLKREVTTNMRRAQSPGIARATILLVVGHLTGYWGALDPSEHRSMGVRIMLVSLAAGLLAVAIARIYVKPLPVSFAEWLNVATRTLREDVMNGRRAAPDDIALAVATGGAAIILSAPLFAPLAANFAAATRIVGPSSLDSV